MHQHAKNQFIPSDGDELFLWYGWPTKGVSPYFQPGPLSEILTISSLWHTVSRILTFSEPVFRLCWIKLCSNDNHYTTAPQIHSWDRVNFRVSWPAGHTHFWPCPQKIYVNLYQSAKKRLFHWFVLEIWLITKSCNLIGCENFGQYVRNKNFHKYGISARTQQIT